MKITYLEKSKNFRTGAPSLSMVFNGNAFFVIDYGDSLDDIINKLQDIKNKQEVK